MSINVSINDYKFQIHKHNFKDMYIGIFKNDASLPNIYGDSIKEVIDQAEELISKKMEGMNNELC